MNTTEVWLLLQHNYTPRNLLLRVKQTLMTRFKEIKSYIWVQFNTSNFRVNTNTEPVQRIVRLGIKRVDTLPLLWYSNSLSELYIRSYFQSILARIMMMVTTVTMTNVDYLPFWNLSFRHSKKGFNYIFNSCQD